ncbi:MAG: PQQ-dependent sugar dehydrogenase [Porticoccus sp.]
MLHNGLRAIIFVFIVCFGGQIRALPSEFSDELVLGNLVQPVALEFLSPDQVLILGRDGLIISTNPNDTVPIASPYLQIPDVDSDGEKGLLGIALDPAFDSNGYFYVYYHNSVNDRARISRFEHAGGTADPASELLIWEDLLTTSLQVISDHWGGAMSFGPDGNLFLAIGDKKDVPADSQDLTLAAGKIIRVDPRGVASGGPWVFGEHNPHLIPSDNPFIDGEGGNLDEIWALGLRNPFRGAWDLPSGRFYLAEVGANVQSGVDASHEDLHVFTLDDAGANAGWPECEGPSCSGPQPANYSPPLFSIVHPDSRALIAGPIFRSPGFPSQYQDVLFIGDFARGWLRYLTLDQNGDVDSTVPVGGHVFADRYELRAPVDFEAGPDGALYYADINGGNAVGNGHLRRIKYAGNNLPPVITSAEAAPVTSPTAPLLVEVSGSAYDPEGGGLDLSWDFGDGSQSAEATTSHTFKDLGAFEATFRADDGAQLAVSDPILIELGIPPVVVIDEPADNALFRAGDLISIRGSATDTDGVVSNDDLRWTIGFGHDSHVHPVLTDVAGTPCAPTGSSCIDLSVPGSGHDFQDNTSFVVSLSVTDSDGLTRSNEISLLPDKVNLTLGTNIPGEGATIFLDGVPRTTPVVVDSLIGFQHIIAVSPEVTANGHLYTFDSWTNGESLPTQAAIVPTIDSTITAFYTDTGPTAERVIDGLQVLYTFDTGSGSTVNDVSGVGAPLDLTIASPTAVTWGAGTLTVNSSTVLSSTGAATKVSNAVQASNAITVEAWVAPANTTQTGPARLVSIPESNSRRNLTLGQTANQWIMAFRTSTTGTNGLNPHTGTPEGSATTALTHIVYTREASGLAHFYVNNELVATETVSGDSSNWNSGYSLLLGNEAAENKPWLGLFDLVAIYDRALSEAEVEQNFAAASGGGVN